MTNSIGEIEFNDVLFIIGSNAPEAHPIIGNKMKRATLHGAKLIVVDPRRTELADYAHLWLRLRPGTDNALVNGLLYLIISNGWHDEAYIEERCENFDDLWKVVQHYPPERVSEITGVPVEQIREAAELYALTPKAGIFYTLGITEHTTGTANVMNLANLAMVTGHIGVENAGVNPLRGQNNVQGSCDMGALPNSLPGYPSVNDEAARARFSAAYGVTMPEKMGLRIPEMLDMAVYGKLKAMFVMGEDPALTDADANHVRKALDSLEFLVAQNLFMTETAKYADVFLPAACYAEKDGTFTNTERRVQRVRKAVEPPGAVPPRLGDHRRPLLPPGPRDALRLARGHLRRDAHPGAAVRRHHLRAHRQSRAAVALPRHRAPGHQVPARRRLHARQGPAAGHRVRGAGRAVHRRVPHPAHHRAHALPLQHHDPPLGQPRGPAAPRARPDEPARRRAARPRRGRHGAGRRAGAARSRPA